MESPIRATQILGFVFFALLFFICRSAPSHNLLISNAERRIDLTSHIVKVYLTLKVENAGSTPTSEILLAFPPTQVDHLATVEALVTKGKRKKTTLVRLDVKPTELPDAPNGNKYFTIYLANPLSSGESTTLEVLYLFTHSLEPFPAEIGQSESQLVYYRDSALILSPYHIKQQTTFIKTPSTKVESFTRVEPANRAGTEMKYGPYEDHPPYSFSPILIHFENNSPFPVVEELVREIEISHWGNLQVTEQYTLVHGGARHKGVFSRVDYQSRPTLSGASSLRQLLARLPPRVHSVYYRDEIGNISSSHLRTDSRKSELEIEPRYPLFGGWKATFVIGYGLPLQDFLFESSDDRRYLNFTFGCPLLETVVDKLTVKVVLPEGSKDPSAVVPFPVEQHLETKYSYLDVVGRTVVVIEKKNLVPVHNSHFQVYYTFKPIFMLAEPLMLASAFFLFFVACVAYLHIDLSIRLRLFKEAKHRDSHGGHWGDHSAIMAVGMVDGTLEAVFLALMSLSPSRSEWDFCVYHGSVVECLDGHIDIIREKLYSDWLPWGMKRRDLLLQRYWRREEDGIYVILYHSVVHKKCPPQSGYVQAHLKSGGYVITPVNQGQRSIVKHVLAIDRKFWKFYPCPSAGRSMTISILKRVAALRELFKGKQGNCSSKCLSMEWLRHIHLPQTEKTDNNIDTKEDDLIANEVEKPDEFFDVPEASEFTDDDHLESEWNSEPSFELCAPVLTLPLKQILTVIYT